jgi:hypothetical protein
MFSPISFALGSVFLACSSFAAVPAAPDTYSVLVGSPFHSTFRRAPQQDPSEVMLAISLPRGDAHRGLFKGVSSELSSPFNDVDLIADGGDGCDDETVSSSSSQNRRFFPASAEGFEEEVVPATDKSEGLIAGPIGCDDDEELEPVVAFTGVLSWDDEDSDILTRSWTRDFRTVPVDESRVDDEDDDIVTRSWTRDFRTLPIDETPDDDMVYSPLSEGFVADSPRRDAEVELAAGIDHSGSRLLDEDEDVTTEGSIFDKKPRISDSRSAAPSESPSGSPSAVPSAALSDAPSSPPSFKPSSSPSMVPNPALSSLASAIPSTTPRPSAAPSTLRSASPSIEESSEPTSSEIPTMVASDEADDRSASDAARAVVAHAYAIGAMVALGITAAIVVLAIWACISIERQNMEEENLHGDARGKKRDLEANN